MKKFPTAFTILFVLIVVVAALTWIIPAGQYERAMNPTLGREAPVPGTYALVEPNPQGLVAVLMAPIAGLYDPATGMANAVDVAVFVLIIGGFLAVVTKTGVIDAGIGWLLTALKGREIWMIPILMAAFAAGGTSYGMAEESLAFYAIVLPVFIRAGYDALTGVAVIMLGCGIGTLGSTFNAFATVIASNAAGVPFTDGLMLRVFILFACLAAGILYVMRYAKRVQAEPARSVVAAQREDNIQHILKGSEHGAPLPEFNRVREVILALFGLTFVMMLYGVIARVVPSTQLATSAAPLADVARVMWGALGGVLVAIGAVISTFGTLNGFTLLTGQVPYGAALDRVFPERLGRLSRYGTPANALVFSNLLASILVAMNFAHGLVAAFNAIILLAVMSSLLPYALCALAELMILLRTGRTVAGPEILKVAILGALGFLYALWAIYGAGAETVFLGFLLPGHRHPARARSAGPCTGPARPQHGADPDRLGIDTSQVKDQEDVGYINQILASDADAATKKAEIMKLLEAD